LQEPYHDPDGIDEKSAVGGLVHQRVCGRTIDPDRGAAFDFVMLGAHQDALVDALPSLRPNRRDRGLQR
jgi:hypothetical protein